MVGLRNRLLLGVSSDEDDIVIEFCTPNAFMANLQTKFGLENQGGNSRRRPV